MRIPSPGTTSTDHRPSRRLIAYLALLAVLVSGASITVWGQPVRIRPSVGYETGRLLSMRRNPGVVNRFTFDGMGRSRNDSYWLGADIEIPDLLHVFDALLRLRVGASHGWFRSNPYGGNWSVDAGTSEPITTSNRFELRSRQNAVQADALMAYDELWGFVMTAGPWASLRLSSTTVQTEYIVDPANAYFQGTTSNERLIDAGDVLESFPLRYGFIAGIGYDIPLWDGAWVRPMIASRCDMEALTGGLGLRAFNLDAGLSLRIEESTSSDSPAPPLIDTNAIIAQRSDIQATVDLFNMDGGHPSREMAVIKTQHTVHRRYIPLAPVIVFDRGSDTLSHRYRAQRRLSQGADSLHHTPAQLQTDILNIIGRRLQETPEGRLTLRGTFSHGETPARGKRRAEAVASYLHEEFNIAPSRITIESGNRGHSGPQLGVNAAVVRIQASPAALLAPSLIQWMEQDYLVPNIGVNKRISSVLGVKEWEMIIRQGETQLARFTKNDDIGGEFNATFPLANFAVDSVALPLIAELTVVDHGGIKKIAGDKLLISIARPDTADDRELRTYMFLPPDSTYPELTAVNQALISNIVSAARQGARITIRSYDTPENDSWSSLKLAEEIVLELNKRSIDLRELRVLNEQPKQAPESQFPESALFARAISVTMEQRTGR